MKLSFVTPYGVVYKDDEIETITLPTKEGIVTIKDDHVPILYLIVPGEILIEDKTGQTFEFAVSKGILEVIRESYVQILADTAERAEHINIERAEEAKRKAEEYLAQKDYEADIDFAKVEAQLEKEIARIRVARKYKDVGKTS